jgi:dephospho-CoA kinase
MLRVGLTGGIASGKSHVRRRLEAAGLAVIDLDDVAHRVMAPGGSAYAEVLNEFGPDILAPDRTVDRRALGTLVFRDPAARARLNALVHPRVREEEEKEASRLARAPGSILVTDAALLIEAGIHLRFDRLVVTYCSPPEQLRRLEARDGLDAEAARARLAAQMDGGEKRRFAHHVIDTSGSVEETDRAVAALVPELRALAALERQPVLVSVERGLASLACAPAAAGGIGPGDLFTLLLETEHLDLQELAARVRPPVSGPWNQAGRLGAADVSTACAMPALVLWSLARRGSDPTWLAGAAASVARVTHAAPEAWAGAVLLALSLEHVALTGTLDGLAAALDGWSAEATGWGGAAPQAEVVEAIRAAAAGRATAGTLGGALVGLAGGRLRGR